jgi:hypothetical protein
MIHPEFKKECEKLIGKKIKGLKVDYEDGYTRLQIKIGCARKLLCIEMPDRYHSGGRLFLMNRGVKDGAGVFPI